MFTSIDKALTALIMAAVYLANSFLNTGLIVDQETVAVIVSVLTPALVWLIPNKGA